jgi:hypothetical protein
MLADFPVPIRVGRVDTSEIAVSEESDYGTSENRLYRLPRRVQRDEAEAPLRTRAVRRLPPSKDQFRDRGFQE